MEAFIALATAAATANDESTLTGTENCRSLAGKQNNNSTTTNNNNTLSSSATDSSGRSAISNNLSQLQLQSLSARSRELLDNGHYWKYLVGSGGTGDSKPAMVPQEPTMTSNDGVSKTPSPTATTTTTLGGLEESILKLKAASLQTEQNKLLSKLPSVNSVPPTPLSGVEVNLNLNSDRRGSSNSSSDEQFRGINVPNNNSSPRIKSPAADSTGGGGGGSDVERFDGRIVYNPDGSAYIIEDSELSEDDGNLDLPQIEGCIVDGRGRSGVSSIPNASLSQITNAFYVSRNPALYSALYGQAFSSLLQGGDKTKVPDIPIMHSYRVYTVRDNKSGDTRSADEEEEDEDDEDLESDEDGESPQSKKKSRSKVKGQIQLPLFNASATSASSECSSVPIKPILMCFICKLSFGYTKSFVNHAMGDHNLSLSDQEKEILSQRNVSAIIQCVGKLKDPIISFLEPVGNSIGGVPILNHGTGGLGLNKSHHNPITQQSTVPISKSNNNSDSNLPLTLINRNSTMADDGLHSSMKKSTSSSPATSPDLHSPREDLRSSNTSLNLSKSSNNPSSMGMDLTRKSPGSGRNSASPGTSVSPAPTPVTPTNQVMQSPNNNTPNNFSILNPNNQAGGNSNNGPPNFMTGTTIGVCPEHMNGRPSGVDCSKCELILNSSRMGALGSLHTRNSCKTLKCPKCNWHYKYQETLEIHMKEKHPDNETSCIYCIAGQPHPRLARGETYTCGYKPYRCEVCNYSTTTKGNLSIHMQSDKHLNNMQELQNGGVPPPESLVQQQQQSNQPTQPQPKNLGMSPSASATSGGTPAGNNSGNERPGTGSGIPQSPKPKPTFRCDVCNYETNVARNLRIHMTSEKHTHNMMVLQQNVKHMQHLSVLQAQAPFDPSALMQFHPSLSGLQAAAAAAAAAQASAGNSNGGPGGEKPNEAALADMAYNQALLIQMMTGGQMPPHIPPELAPHMDLGLNPDTMEPPPEPPEPNPSHLFQCCVCTTYNTDSLEALSHHLTQDRTKLREQEILVLVAGNYMCKLCSYKTNLKANFQLHCKTDKHLQRLQHVNHIKEGGPRNEWKLKYLSMSNPIQVRCNACDYYTNSAHKLQLHAAHQRHEISVLIFRHLQSQETIIHEDCRIYACALCGFTSRVKLQLLQHTRSLKHLQLEQLHILQRRAEGKDALPDLSQVFRVLEQPDNSDSPGPSSHPGQLHSDYLNDQDSKEMMLIKKEQHEGRNSSVLKNALEKDSSSDYSDLSCPYCTFVTDSESRLQAHVTTQHSGTGLSMSLSSTGHHHRASISPDSKSEPSHHQQNSGMACPLCQETCSDRHRLETHVMQVHSVNSEGLQRLLLLVNQSHWLNTSSSSSPGRNSGGNQSSSSNDLKSSDSNDENEKDNKSESESCLEDSTSDNEEFRCSTCSKCFRSLDDLCIHQNELGHLEIRQTPGGPGYQCWKKGCNQYFPTAPSLQMHFREIHARGKNSSSTMAVSEKHVYKYRCNQCSLAFKTIEKLQLHSQYHAIRDASKCCLCGRSFRSLVALQKHVETSHTELSEDELLQFKQSIASNPLLLAGLTGQVLDQSMTELLKKESARDDELLMDEDNRLDESMDKDGDGQNESGDGGDSGDSMGSKDQQQLFEDYLNTQAMAEDSYNDPNRKYKCHRCKVAFTRQSYLTSHNKTLLHRKGEKLSYPMEKYLDPNRPYKCEVCKESFTQKNILLVHYNSVSHLHKLKRAMQEQQQVFLSNFTGTPGPTPTTTTIPPSPSPLMSPASSTGGNKQGANNTGVNSNSTTTTPTTDDEDKKPFKCNICKVAYSQVSTLDIHMKSVLHQTRASKLQELALTGQIDLSKPLIEQPEPQKLYDAHKKLMQEMLSGSPKGILGDLRPSSPVSSNSTSPQTLSSVSPAGGQGPSAQSNFSCSRCNTVCGSAELLLQHQHLYCLFSTNPLALFPPLPSPNSTSTPNTSLLTESQGQDGSSSPPLPSSSADEQFQRFIMPSRKSSQLYKHILESYGFEIVMQFNEYHQKRRRAEAERQMQDDEMSTAVTGGPTIPESMEIDEQILREFPELAKSTCPYCKKVFSSVWILKAHCEEIHKDVISMDILENFADDFRSAYMKKLEVSAILADHSDKEMLDEKDLSKGSSGDGLPNGNNNNNNSLNHPTAPSTPTASITPASSSESVNGRMENRESRNQENNNMSNNLQMSLAQQMNEVQAALMAASQLGQFNPMLNPMMLASLQMAMPLGFNMNALAAMNLQPPLVPMMMPPPFDHPMNSMSASGATTPTGTPNQMYEQMGKQQQQQSQQQQQQQQAPQVNPSPVQAAAAAAAAAAAGNSQQKRARTRITDDQLKILRAHFDINNSPSEEQISQMAAQSGLPPKVIKHWFRNTLFKERQRNKDSPYNFSNPPSTTLNLEEYEKTGEAQVKNLNAEEQKAYEPPTLPSATIKKEPKEPKIPKSQLQQQPNLHELNMNHHQEMFDMMSGNVGCGDISETESRSEAEEPPKKKANTGKGKGSKNSRSSSSTPSMISENMNLNINTNSLNLSSLIQSQMNNAMQGSFVDNTSSSPTPQAMLPPKTSSNSNNSGGFTAPSATSLLSLASPVNLNSPGSSCGRGENPSMTTPPLSNCPSTGSMSSGKRANRTRFTDYQIKVLQEFFENNAYPKDDDLEYLSKLLGLSPRVIVVWFQNARQKARKVYENQPAVDTPDESSGRFQRTPGLNYQCKKCQLVFQRYYELIRHQKTHCFKEEDAKRSAQAQAAAAQVASLMSSEDSNCSEVTDNNSLTSSCGPSPSAAIALGNCNNSNQSAASAAALFNAEMKAQGLTVNQNSSDETFQCDKCNLVFPRFDLWREHQLVHLMNPNLFPSFSPESPFGILQQHAQAQAQQQQQQLLQQNIKIEPKDSQVSPSESSSIAGDATGKRKWSADEHTEDESTVDLTESQARDKRLRTTILPEQLDYLYQKYQIESNPSRKMLETISLEVGLKKRVVQVWFQNTRARERKGHMRAHVQAINKRCPFCPALFKVKSALEGHLAAKHPDQYSKGDINIDSLPDEEFDRSTSPTSESSKVPNSFGATTNSGAPTSPSPNIMAPFLHSLTTHAELETSLKKLYEESLKRYAQEAQHQQSAGVGNTSHNGRPELGNKRKNKDTGRHSTGGTAEFPLDLSKPVDLSRADTMDDDFLSDEDDMNMNMNDHDVYEYDSVPNSPASSTASTQQLQLQNININTPASASFGPNNSNAKSNAGAGNAGSGAGNKRFRTQMSSLQVKVMKNLFADYKTPTMTECEMLGREIGLAIRVVQVWFQNARAKEKKHRLALQKLEINNSTTTNNNNNSSSSLFTEHSPKVPDDCKLCGFQYSHKYSVQDHIFTRGHIDSVKLHIGNGKNEKRFRKPNSNLGKVKIPPPSSSSINGGDPAEPQAVFLQQQQQQQLQILQHFGMGLPQPQEPEKLSESILQLYGLGTITPAPNPGIDDHNHDESKSEQTPTAPDDGSGVQKTLSSNYYCPDGPTFNVNLNCRQNEGLGFGGVNKNNDFHSPVANVGVNYLIPNEDDNDNDEDDEDEDEFEDAHEFGYDGPPNELLESLNIYPNKNQNHGTSSGEINSEMEYVVQKIAALARATTTPPETGNHNNHNSGTNSNANISMIK